MSPTPDIARFDPFSGMPCIHGPTRMGVRPGTEFLHRLAVTGTRPLVTTVEGLPDGLSVDSDGVLRGTAPGAAGMYTLHVHVTNDLGATTGVIELVVGDTLALTPPMGWNSWNVHADTVDAAVVVAAAQALVDTGMADMGYGYVNIDDHWHASARAKDGRPRANPDTFPDGIEGVAEQVHALGLKLGIYSDAAHLTCGGCYGGYGYEDIDARTYASWGVDLLKYDYCYAPSGGAEARRRYRMMAEALERSGRSILFSVCEWGFRKPWQWAADLGASMWRTTPDIFDDFGWTPLGVRFIARRNLKLGHYAGPGHWNDPDMLVVGNRGGGLATGVVRLPNQMPRPFAGRRVWSFRGLNDTEAHTHMSLWAMMAAPLLASHDLAASSEFDLALLTNPEVLAIDQDPLGVQGRPVASPPGIWQIVKPLVDGGFAVSVTNVTPIRRRVTVGIEELAGTAQLLAVGLGELAGTGQQPPIGIDRSGAPTREGSARATLTVIDAWTLEGLGCPSTIRVDLPAHGTRVLVCRSHSGLPRTGCHFARHR